jgi:hypothetical protein
MLAFLKLSHLHFYTQALDLVDDPIQSSPAQNLLYALSHTDYLPFHNVLKECIEARLQHRNGGSVAMAVGLSNALNDSGGFCTIEFSLAHVCRILN